VNLGLEVFLNFIRKIQGGYKDIPYHNKTHAADLVQSFYYFGKKCGLIMNCKLDEVDLLAITIAGACHDHEHPGFNNMYLIDNKDPIAISYNDQSVLENHHIASSFAVMLSDAKYNVLTNLNREDFKKARSLMIGCVLATDMSKHFGECSKFKTRIGADDYDPSKGLDKDSSIHMLFHLADISNATKPWELCQKWTDLLFFGEFFVQGDRERDKGTPISYLMDRTTINVAKSQIGFIDVIILPSFTTAA